MHCVVSRLIPALPRTSSQEERTHESSETLESPWDTNARVHLDKNTPRSVDVHLQLPTLVQRRIQQRKQALHGINPSISSSPPRLISRKVWAHLVRDIWPRVRNVPPHLGQHSLVVVAVEQAVLVLPLAAL